MDQKSRLIKFFI